MWLSCLEALGGLLFGFLGFALGMFFGTVIFNSGGIGLFFAFIGFGHFLNLANRIQEKIWENKKTKQSAKQSFNSELVEMIKNTAPILLKNFDITYQREVY